MQLAVCVGLTPSTKVLRSRLRPLQAEGTALDAPLLVKAHGGPAGGVVASRVSAANDAHLLFSGFRIFSPAFRGSTGFGDEFTAANIDCQVRILLDFSLYV